MKSKVIIEEQISRLQDILDYLDIASVEYTKVASQLDALMWATMPNASADIWLLDFKKLRLTSCLNKCPTQTEV